MRIFLVAAALCLLGFPGWSNDQAYIDGMKRRFSPALPTVALTYRVSYRLLGMNLIEVAYARLESTEGYWVTPASIEPVRACFMELALQTPNCEKKNSEKSRVYINNKLISVVTMPELTTLYYIKKTDESIRPLFGKGKRVNSMHIYNLESDALDFYSRDYLTGTVRTNLENGAMDMAAQGREVIDVLTRMSDVYNERIGHITPDSEFRIYVNCDGTAVPFAARTRTEHIHLLGHQWKALRCDVMPAREAPKIKNRDFAMWAVSLDTFAEVIDDPVIRDIAEQTPDWSMTPLLANYELCLGAIRCTLDQVETIDNTGVTLLEAEKQHSQAIIISEEEINAPVYSQ
ncbi:MAG: hypothetical protein EOM20_00385 [Spartobacteria bacterium]|nr:hypothetical protein [Spartobacteria bacterium]